MAFHSLTEGEIMRLIALIIAVLVISTGAEARTRYDQKVQPRQTHYVVKQDPPPMSPFGAGWRPSIEPVKVIKPQQTAPRPYARRAQPQKRFAALQPRRTYYARYTPPRARHVAFYQPRYHWRTPTPRSRHVDAPPPQAHAYTAPTAQTTSPALYALTKVTAVALGVTDHSLLFEPTTVAARPHLSKIAPWAGALVF
jgi:hypothetical protein